MIRRLIRFCWICLKACNPIYPEPSLTWSEAWKRAKSMKKLFLILLVGLMLVGCPVVEEPINTTPAINAVRFVNVQIVKIQGHTYIIVDSKRGNYGGGVAIVHAEHCQCKKN